MKIVFALIFSCLIIYSGHAQEDDLPVLEVGAGYMLTGSKMRIKNILPDRTVLYSKGVSFKTGYYLSETIKASLMLVPNLTTGYKHPGAIIDDYGQTIGTADYETGFDYFNTNLGFDFITTGNFKYGIGTDLFLSFLKESYSKSDLHDTINNLGIEDYFADMTDKYNKVDFGLSLRLIISYSYKRYTLYAEAGAMLGLKKVNDFKMPYSENMYNLPIFLQAGLSYSIYELNGLFDKKRKRKRRRR